MFESYETAQRYRIALVVGVLVSPVIRPSSPLTRRGVTFTSLKGERVSTSDLRGHVVLVNFWATDCPTCVKEMPSMVKTYNKYHKQGFELVAVAMRHDPRTTSSTTSKRTRCRSGSRSIRWDSSRRLWRREAHADDDRDR